MTLFGKYRQYDLATRRQIAVVWKLLGIIVWKRRTK